MAQRDVWIIKWEDHEYEWFGISSLNSSRLRAFKQYYGPDYGKALTFQTLYMSGDVDAVACVIWAVLKEAAKEPGSDIRCPDRPDGLPEFSVGDFVTDPEFVRRANFDDGADPTEGDISPQTPVSTKTSTSSAAKRSGTAASSAA